MRSTLGISPPQTDFLVVGAGPVGLVTAILLGREGWRVTVVERWPSHYPMPRACTIDHEALRILQSAGVMREHTDLFEPSRGERGGYQIRNGEGVLLQAINWNRPSESGWANTNGFYQPDLEGVLESMATELETVNVRRGWSASAIAQDANGVTLTVTGDQACDTEQLRAAWLVAADGANSTIRELLHIESVDSGFEADWLVVDYEPIIDRRWEAFVTQYCDPRQPATAVNSGPGRRRFEFMRRADMTAEDLGRPDIAWSLMKPWDVTPDNARLERHAVYTFRGRWAKQWRRGRVLLAGDAAHLMPPFMGQGLCSGLRDASALSWRLSLIASGLGDEIVLDSYDTERLPHVREIIEAAVGIGELVCELDPVRAAERDARMITELNDPAARTVEPPHPRLGIPSITMPESAVAGTLSIQGTVELDGVVGLFDDVVGGTWQLVAVDHDPLATVPSDLREWYKRIGGTATAIGEKVLDIDGVYGAWFAAHDCSVFLSRPDFYLFGTGTAADIPELLASLREVLTGSDDHQKEGILP